MNKNSKHTSLRLSRRGFLTTLTAASVAFLMSIWQRCTVKKNHRPRIEGASHQRGHRLWKKDFPSPDQTREADVLIVGAGVSAWSAARILSKQGVSVTLLELESMVGGNSSSGANSTGKYPLGAHYLPIPNPECTALLEFLKEAGIVLNVDAEGRVELNDYDVCFAPESRLLIHGYWQQGLLPRVGVPKEDTAEIVRFLQYTDSLKHLRGKDKKYVFAIPLDESSQDEEWLALDQITFGEWCKQQGYSSSYLHWYLSYCCRDDYGAGIDTVSAWAGLHYFACRKGMAKNTGESNVLTWPEGNARLVQELEKQSKASVFPNQLVYQVEKTQQGVQVESFDFISQRSIRWKANQVILATPMFITNKILSQQSSYTGLPLPSYSPWLVANLVVQNDLQRAGAPLSWDNVLYDSDCLGYIYAQHQDIKRFQDKITLTYYHPLDHLQTAAARKEAIQNTPEQWAEIVFQNLSKAHPDIRLLCDSISVWIWGHGMAQPKPGAIWGELRKQRQQPIDPSIFFAHSDLSGISIFEEAFYQGIRAANQLLHARS
jgi:protoporphyrinogen oxidase